MEARRHCRQNSVLLGLGAGGKRVFGMFEAGAGRDPAAGQERQLRGQVSEAFHGVEPGTIRSPADRVHARVDVEGAQRFGPAPDIVQPALKVVVQVT
jgi:hypothetical protein